MTTSKDLTCMGKPQYQKPSDEGMKGWCVRVYKKWSSPRIIPSGCFIVEVPHFQSVIQIFQLHKLLSTRTVSCYWRFLFTYFTDNWSSLMLVSCFVCIKGWAVQLSCIQNRQLSQQLKSTPFMIMSFGHNSEWRSSTTSCFWKWLIKWSKTWLSEWTFAAGISLQHVYEWFLHFYVK
jgi:hypothetical protein